MRSRSPSQYPLSTFVFSSSSSLKSPLSSNKRDEDLSLKLYPLVPHQAVYSKEHCQSIPVSFSPQNDVWKDLLQTPSDQGECGSCWSFSSVGCLMDRFHIMYGKQIFEKTALSALVPTLCNDLLQRVLDEKIRDSLNNPFRFSSKILNETGCHGNALNIACLYLVFFGTTTNTCIPTDIQDPVIYKTQRLNLGFRIGRDNIWGESRHLDASCGMLNQASVQGFFTTCVDFLRINYVKTYGTPQRHIQSLFTYYILPGEGVTREEAIRQDIFQFGPIVTSFIVYPDFYEYNPNSGNGIYTHIPSKSDVPVGGHAVEIIGWGTSNEGIPYWWIKNSWGKDYGINGYFRFLRGQNQCEIESNAMGMIPNPFFHGLGSIPESRRLEKEISSSGLFHTEMTPEYHQILEKTYQLLSPHPDFTYMEACIRQFPFLHYPVLIHVNPNQIVNLTTTGYSDELLRHRPNLMYNNYNISKKQIVSHQKKDISHDQLLLLVLCLLFLTYAIILNLRHPANSSL